MKVGMMGLGKLGLPVALAIEAHGHEVLGHDPSELVSGHLAAREVPYVEAGVAELLEQTQIRNVSVAEVVEHADVVLVAVQTPHQARFEGCDALTDERADFDYATLGQAVRQLRAAWTSGAGERRETPLVVIVSTVLPGTCARVVAPVLDGVLPWCYSPSFIAMGTTIADFTHPEMVLCGDREHEVGPDHRFVELHRSIHDAPLLPMRVESAELAKVAYNTAIGLKIALANTVMEIAHHTGADCDEVTDALACATDRVVSAKYLRGGMGDGGGCHPRDNIALSWLARRLGLSHDLFSDAMRAREDQARWLVRLLREQARLHDLDVGIAGIAYKANSNLTVGSPARLVLRLLGGVPTVWDPVVHPNEALPRDPHVWLVGCDHDAVLEADWPPGCVVVDPWGKVADRDGVTVVRIGRKS